jgi:lipoprotein-releasing system ATP-binding protein
MSDHLLIASKISKSFAYPHTVSILKDVSLNLLPGEFIAIQGRSGEGKSTLLHILGTLEKPDKGTLLIDGIDTANASLSTLRNDKIGFVFQAFHLLDDYTVLDNVMMPSKIARKPTTKGSTSWQRALSLLESVHLTHRLEFPVRLLSGGEKQRVAIARALMNDPKILLADEPSGNLDAASRELIHQLLIELCKKEKKALVIVTHDKELARLADRILILKEGQLHERDPA